MPTLQDIITNQDQSLSALDKAAYNTFGLDPSYNQDRLTLLPRRKNGTWIAPQIANQLARAFLAPGVAAGGDPVSTEDAIETGLTLTGAASPVKIPGGSLGMGSVVRLADRRALNMNLQLARLTQEEQALRALAVKNLQEYAEIKPRYSAIEEGLGKFTQELGGNLQNESNKFRLGKERYGILRQMLEEKPQLWEKIQQNNQRHIDYQNQLLELHRRRKTILQNMERGRD